MSTSNEPGRGGDIIFMPGRGGVAKDGRKGVDGSIIFRMADGSDWMRLEPDGRVTVRGRLVASDVGAYLALVAWLANAVPRFCDGTADGTAAIFVPHEQSDD